MIGTNEFTMHECSPRNPERPLSKTMTIGNESEAVLYSWWRAMKGERDALLKPPRRSCTDADSLQRSVAAPTTFNSYCYLCVSDHLHQKISRKLIFSGWSPIGVGPRWVGKAFNTVERKSVSMQTRDNRANNRNVVRSRVIVSQNDEERKIKRSCRYHVGRGVRNKQHGTKKV